jgi:hypothetical protein
MGERRNAYMLIVGKPEGKSPTGRPRGRWVDNIKTDFGEIGWSGVDWTGVVQEKDQYRGVVNAGFITCLGTVEQLHNWRPLK